eukprot:scaffold874_cov126-Cylindrotheca_fusiformis.AAC.26
MDESGEGNGQDELQSLRLFLEQSWNAETMGEIPSDSSVAAKEAVETIETASENGVSIFLVDLLLPAYDINQGSHLYDEVLAVEYCIALSEYLKGKSSILVRDSKTVEIVSRILKVREDTAMEEIQQQSDNEGLIVEAIVDEDQEDEDIIEEGDEDASIPTSDVDSFRQSLMANWDLDEEENATSNQESGPIVDPPPAAAPKTGIQKGTDSSKPKPTSRRHRLGSLFGDRVISQGADMVTDVVNAVRDNALPEKDEENLIILSSSTLAETVAVRSLVGKYGDQKKVILVNCKLDPLPPELRTAETVYSIMPLVSKEKGSGESHADESPAPKVVVLRRYPKPWEIYVDVGIGFQLADSIAPSISNKRGIRMDQITNIVKRFLR